LILVVTNVYIDPANVFHNFSKDAAESILSGNEIYVTSDNLDERGVRYHMIKSMPGNIECIAVGPSLSFGIRSSEVGTENFYNLSASRLNFYDYMSVFGLMEAYSKKADHVILCVDSYFFDESKYSGGSSFAFGNKYAEYMEAILNGDSPVLLKESENSEPIELNQAFSITYFQVAVKYIQAKNSYILKQKRWGKLDNKTENLLHYMPDGSLVYSLDFRNRTVDNVLADINKYDIAGIFSKGKHINRYNVDIFEKLVCYLMDKGTKIDLYLHPLPPSLWDRIENDGGLE